MKIMLLTVIAVFGFGQLTIAAQTKKFRWADETCEYEGTFDARKYTAAELENTVKLMMGAEFDLAADATVWKYEDIGKLSVAALDREYEEKSAALKNLKIVDSPYWEARRRRYLNELDQVYRLSRVTIAAYENPAVLGDFKFAETCVATYAGPLAAGGADLLRVWRAVNEDSRRRNGDPERLRRIFDEQSASPDREKFARVEVMNFGWWNCANEFVRHVENDDRPGANFKKLFARVRTISCDEP
jgi:hypothetical protein